MTPDDFISLFPDFPSLASGRQTQLLVYFLTVVQGLDSVTGADVEKVRADAHLAPSSSANLLSRASKGSARTFIKKSKGYGLERSIREGIRSEVEGRPTATQTSATLRTYLASVPAGPSYAYLAEAVGCFESGFHRASIVMGWCLGFSILRDWMFQTQLVPLNAKMGTWRKPKVITAISDFDELAERVILDTARDSKCLSKSAHKILVALLDQRNSYAHPSGRSVSEAAAEAYLQQVVDEVLLKFG